MADFKLADQRKPAEGVISNEVTDRGGLTVFGHAYSCSKNAVRYWEKIHVHIAEANGNRAQLVAALKADAELVEMAAQMFKKGYWDPFNLDELPDQALAEEIYEQAVNMGGGTSAKNIQEALNLCNTKLVKNEVVQLWPDLALDMQIGPATHAALKSCQASGRMKNLLDVINSLQAEDYINIARRSPSQRVYIPGWISQRVEVGAGAS